jgi:L-threonylcarbamoyladenylate synthase
VSSSSIGTDVERAVDVLRAGGLVGLPTETVYGLAADARNEAAVRHVFATKGRPLGHPLIVHVADVDEARRWASDWPIPADLLVERFWPGPLTVIVRRRDDVLDVVTGGRDTVAVRVPDHPLAQSLLRSFGGGLVAPSANFFGRVSPTTARHVVDDLGDAVGYVLDGGPCTIGVESTIVDCSVDPPQVLRPGAVSEVEVRQAIGSLDPASGPSRAPGMLASHYAPSCEVVPVESLAEAERLIASTSVHSDTVILDASLDPVRFASRLYAELRRCDAEGRRRVVIVLPPDDGIGRAVRDRITKAAAPRH